MSLIITDEAFLRVPCEPVKDIREGGEVARKLRAAIEQHNKRTRKQVRAGKIRSASLGVGLAAPQIGIRKRVCLVYVNELPLVLINPVIVAHSHVRIPFKEGCLSFPGKAVDTWRYIWVTIQTMNHGEITLGPTDPSSVNETSLLKSVVTQHEIDHLDGILFFERKEDV